MENFNQISTLLDEQRPIGLNFDILESGVFNIACLVGILIYVGRGFLSATLNERQKKIIQNVQDAEEKLISATFRLNEAKKQLAQAQVIIKEIQAETLKTKNILLESTTSQTNEELALRFNRALITLNAKEQQVFSDIKQQIINLALKNLIKQIQLELTPNKQSVLISRSIAKLGGQF